MIQLTGVSKRVGDFQLKDINMELPAGYIMGMIGPNGAGKTTLMHLLMGLYRTNDGEVRIFDKTYEDAEKEIHEDIGVVLQERLFDNYRTLRENADFYGSFYAKYDSRILEDYLTQFELEPARKYKQLSKGEELKFQFAFALAHEPKLLILDEATGNFDPEFREKFLQILREFIADGEHSVILSTHITDDLERIADYITYLENGKVLLSTDIESLHDMYRIASGETYKLKLLPKEDVIFIEEGEFGSKALIKYWSRRPYDAMITLTTPTIEELMYFMTKGHEKKKKLRVSKYIFPKGMYEQEEV